MTKPHRLTDQIVLRVLAKYAERSEAGVEKYGTTLMRDDLNLIDWLNHLQEELMDATLYIERLKQDVKYQPNAFLKVDGKLVPALEGQYLLEGGEVIYII